MHIDFFHIGCWKDWWRYGMPMRVYYGDKFITIWPFTGNWRMRRVWDLESAKLVEPPNEC